MFGRCGIVGFLLLLGDAYCDVARSRVRRQNLQSGQLIDSIFNIPITAIRQTAAAAAQVVSPENTQTIDTFFKIPVATLEAVGTLVKATTERRQQNAESIQMAHQERRDRLLALKEQKRKRKEEIQSERLLQQQRKRIVRHYHKDPFGLNALTDLLVGHHGLIGGHHHAGGPLGHHSRPGLHGGHGFHGHGGHGGHGSHGNRPQNTYEVHENVDDNDDASSYSWHGIAAGFGSFFGGDPPRKGVVKIENKIAPKGQKIVGHPSDSINHRNKVARTRSKPENDDPPPENKIAPRSGRVTFAQ